MAAINLQLHAQLSRLRGQSTPTNLPRMRIKLDWGMALMRVYVGAKYAMAQSLLRCLPVAAIHGGHNLATGPPSPSFLKKGKPILACSV